MVSRWMKVLAGVLGMVAAPDLSAQQARPKPYHNVDYQFVVQIPRDVSIQMAPAPASNHGFDVSLGPWTYASVFAAYETEDVSTLSAEVEQNLERWRSEGCMLVERKAVRLGGVPAAELTLSCGPAREPTVRREILALRSPPGRGTMIYHVSASYPRGSRSGAEAERVFRALADGMSFTNDP